MDILLAAISGEALINCVIWLVIAGVVFWLINLLINRIPMDPTIKQVINVILILAVVLICINALLTLIGRPFINWG
jgi:hypothetical protein